MRQTKDGKTTLTRDEAKAFAAFQMNERARHLKDIDHIDKSLKALGKSLSIGWPGINIGDASYEIEGAKLNVPWIDEESISVEKNSM